MTHHQCNYTGRSISLPDEVDSELVKVAKEDGVTVSRLVRRWIKWQLQARRLNRPEHITSPETLGSGIIP
jgi:post-segregation antitoxin (ccd killing protein)